MEAEVIYYCEDHEDVDFSALLQHFGLPEDVAKDFLSEIGANSVSNSYRVKQQLLYFIALFVFVAIVLAASSEIYANYRQEQVFDGYYIESITYEGELTPDVTGAPYVADYFDDDNPQK